MKKILDDAVSIKPRRQMSVQFSGGEPTLSPHFLDAIRYAREIGYFAVQCATNGIRFAQEPELRAGGEGGGPAPRLPAVRRRGQRANQHRKVGNLFDVKLRAIENLHAAGIDVIARGHDRQRRQQRPGRRHRPVRDREHRQDHGRLLPAGLLHRARRGHRRRDARKTQRYTLSPPRARREDARPGIGEPHARLVPALGARARSRDLPAPARRPEADWGSLKCGCHPNCGIGTIVLVHKKTKRGGARHRSSSTSSSSCATCTVITDAARGRCADDRCRSALARAAQLSTRRGAAGPRRPC